MREQNDVQLSYADKAAAAKVLLDQYDADKVRQKERQRSREAERERETEMHTEPEESGGSHSTRFSPG